MENIKVTWSQLKTIRSDILVSMRYVDFGDVYHVFIQDANAEYATDIIKNSGSDYADFENNYKYAIDRKSVFLSGKTPDNILLTTQIKNYAWNSVIRVSHDLCDKCTWHQGSSTQNGMTITDTGDQTSYTWPSDMILPDLITDRDILATNYAPTIKVNGNTVTNYTINPRTRRIVFNSANNVNDVVTADGYKANGSVYDLTASAGKFLLVDYVELQVSKNTIMNDGIYFEAVLNNASTGNADYVAGRTKYLTAKDFYNKSNHGFEISQFGELTQPVLILPWNFVTGYKVFPAGTSVAATEAEFNKLRIRLANNVVPTSCEVATATFYCYELPL